MVRLWVILSLSSFVFLCCCAVAMTHNAGSESRDEDIVLFRKPLEGARELVVVRGPNRPLTDIADIVSDASLRTREAVFLERLEIHAPNMAPLLLFSRLHLVDRGGDYAVLDILVGPRQSVEVFIILATIEDGDIMLWKVCPLGSVRVARIDMRDWTKFATILPPYRTVVRAKLNWTKNRLVEVQVDDLHTYGKQQTKFVQKEKEWKFMPIK